MKKDIISGAAVVPWAPATNPTRGEPLEEGWVLPGGLRTKDVDLAMQVAEQIRSYMRLQPVQHREIQ